MEYRERMESWYDREASTIYVIKSLWRTRLLSKKVTYEVENREESIW